MNIGLNGRHLLIDNPAGPERFTINLYKTLAQIDSTNNYTIFVGQKPNENFVKELFENATNFKFKVIREKFAWTQFWLALDLWLHPVDIFFTPIHTVPFLKNPKIKYLTMIHGLEYKTNNEFESQVFKKIYHPMLLKLAIKFSDKIIAPSNATKQALLNQHWANTEKIVVINEGVDKSFYKRDTKESEDVLNHYGLNQQKYFIFISTIQPRKNIPTLVEAFAKAVQLEPGLMETRLILVGKLGWSYDNILSTPKKLNVENYVKFLNWIPEHDKPFLLSNALGYLNMSLDEGFGLTVLEAMSSEIPAVVSDIAAHREVGGSSIKYVKPNDTAQMAQEIINIYRGNYSTDLVQKAKQNTSNFTWMNTAGKFIELFSALIPH